jgi:hypothetical protein
MFNVNIHCVVFGVNASLNKRCVLSVDNDKLVLPKFILENDLLKNLNENIIKFLKQYVFVNDLELLPQLISLNHVSLNQEQDTLDIVYGFIIDYNSSIDNTRVYWIDFDILKEQQLSLVLLETIQKLS